VLPPLPLVISVSAARLMLVLMARRAGGSMAMAY
jgi:hypothetical protein